MMALAWSQPARADYGFYRVTDLGTIDGYFGSEAVGINDGGLIAGTLFGGGQSRAVRATAGGLHELGTLPGGEVSVARGISSSGVIVGWSQTLDDGGFLVNRAFRSGQSGLENLGATLHVRGSSQVYNARSTYATGVDGSGRVAGYATFGANYQRAFVSDNAGELYDLGTLSGGGYSVANGISNGQVVGTASNDRGLPRAFVTRDLNGIPQLIDLGVLNYGSASYGTAINGAGRIAGYADVLGSHRAVRSTADDRLEDLGLLPEGGETFGLGINAAGDVVGRGTTTGGGSVAILYTDGRGRFIDLNTVTIDPDSLWNLTSATGINAYGEIVGTGMYRGQPRAFLLTPVTVPSPAGLTLAAIGGAGLLGTSALRRRWRNRRPAGIDPTPAP